MGLIYTSIFDVETIVENDSDYINTSTRELIYVKLYSVCCFNASGRLTFYIPVYPLILNVWSPHPLPYTHRTIAHVQHVLSTQHPSGAFAVILQRDSETNLLPAYVLMIRNGAIHKLHHLFIEVCTTV